MNNVVKLLQDLIKFETVTPKDCGSLDFLKDILSKIGFSCHIVKFSEEGYDDVLNLYARLGEKGINLCFAGHIDVVPCGNQKHWDHPPFECHVSDDIVYGRGVVDMKGTIAAFIGAVDKFIKEDKMEHNSISFLITGDEEGIAVNGTKKMLRWLEDRGEIIDYCIIGEPTSKDKVGDTIKVGARGSITTNIEVFGKQGHVAYHEIADNPVPKLASIIAALKELYLDDGNEYFQPSNLEFTNIFINGGTAENLIPASASVQFNIRFGNMHSADNLSKLVHNVCSRYAEEFKISWHSSGEAFVTTHDSILPIVVESIKKETGIIPNVNTLGGTSDARFMANKFQVLEIGLLNKTAHKVNEHASISDLKSITNIYYNVIEAIFSI